MTDGNSLSRRGLLRVAGVAAAAAACGVMGRERAAAAERAATERAAAAATTRATATTAPLPAVPAAGAPVHRVLTCNILFDLPEQKGTPFDWAGGRRDACLDLIRARRADLVCLQE